MGNYWHDIGLKLYFIYGVTVQWSVRSVSRQMTSNQSLDQSVYDKDNSSQYFKWKRNVHVQVDNFLTYWYNLDKTLAKDIGSLIDFTPNDERGIKWATGPLTTLSITINNDIIKRYPNNSNYNNPQFKYLFTWKSLNEKEKNI